MKTMLNELRDILRIANDIDVFDVKQVPCVLISGETKMTWNSFASACLARQASATVLDVLCCDCPVGRQIKLGRKVTPPKNLEIIQAKGWIERPIVYPADRVLKATKYPFRTMDVGEKVDHPLDERKQFLSARAHLRRRYDKWFEYKIVDNKMIIERTK